MTDQGEQTIHEVYAYLRLSDTPAAIDFYARAFGARELFRLVEPGGRVGHAEITIGAVTVMLSDEYPELGIRGPASLGATTVSIHIHASDVDRLFADAVAAGATVVRPLQNHFYEDRKSNV